LNNASLPPEVKSNHMGQLENSHLAGTAKRCETWFRLLQNQPVLPVKVWLASTPIDRFRVHSAWHCHFTRRTTMIVTIAIVLVVLWLLGLVSSYTMGGFIHILLVLAVIIILVRVFQGRRI
jgi:hypothetical protein